MSGARAKQASERSRHPTEIRRQLIVEAARSVIAERGLFATSVRDIAAAGTCQSAPSNTTSPGSRTYSQRCWSGRWTPRNGLAVETPGIAAGLLGGLAAALMPVYRSPTDREAGQSGRVAVRGLLNRRHRGQGRVLLRRRPLVHRLDRGLGGS
jgi:hypothetical protein